MCVGVVGFRVLPTEPNDDDVYYDFCWRLELEGETENMGVCTKERKGGTAAVLMATPCTNSRLLKVSNKPRDNAISLDR